MTCTKLGKELDRVRATVDASLSSREREVRSFEGGLSFGTDRLLIEPFPCCQLELLLE